MELVSPGALMVALAVPIAAASLWHLIQSRRRSVTWVHLRGRTLRPAREVEEHLGSQQQGIPLGRQLLPHEAAYGHIAVVGTTGSGKTILQRLMMQAVLPRVGLGLGQRALVYDAKQDLFSHLTAMRLRCPIVTLHPLDSECAAWDMAADITSPAAALQAASLLVPKAQQDANPFFSNAARHLLYGTILSLVSSAPGRWTFRHLLLIVRSETLLRCVLAQTPFTRHLLQYCGHPLTFQNILSTQLSHTAAFEIIAAAWDRASRKISLRSWINQESILVLANDEDNRAAIDTINLLLFKRLSELVLTSPERTEADRRTTWFMLDEVRQAGRLEGLSALMTKGRSKGAAVLLGFQDINGLQDVYGREVANELIGQCNTKAILRLNSPETAKWASQVFGSSEFLERRYSRNLNRNFNEPGLPRGFSSGESIANAVSNRALVLDSEFLDLPETSPANGLTGFFLSPATGAFKDHLSAEWLRQHLLRPSPEVRRARRPDSDQLLRPWSDNDAAVLGLKQGVGWTA